MRVRLRWWKNRIGSRISPVSESWSVRSSLFVEGVSKSLFGHALQGHGVGGCIVLYMNETSRTRIIFTNELKYFNQSAVT